MRISSLFFFALIHYISLFLLSQELTCLSTCLSPFLPRIGAGSDRTCLFRKLSSLICATDQAKHQSRIMDASMFLDDISTTGGQTLSLIYEWLMLMDCISLRVVLVILSPTLIRIDTFSPSKAGKRI